MFVHLLFFNIFICYYYLHIYYYVARFMYLTYYQDYLLMVNVHSLS